MTVEHVANSVAKRWVEQLELVLIPHYGCNLRCSHCFIAKHATHSSLGRDEFTSLLKQIQTLGISALQVTGGEFFQWKHHRDALESLVQLDLPTAVSTNATAIELADIQTLAAGGMSLSISLDGPPSIHDTMRGRGAYERTCSTVALCAEHGVPFDVATTVTRSTLARIGETVRCAVQLGARAIHVSPLQSLGGRSDRMGAERLDDEDCLQLMAVLTALRDKVPEGFGVFTHNLGLRATTITHPCSVFACWGEFCPSQKLWPSVLYLMPDGELLPQSQHIHERYSLGNVRKTDLSALISGYWGGKAHRRFQTLCRHVYQEQIFGKERPFFYWDELVREASALPCDQLGVYETVSHPYDHGPEIAQAKAKGTLKGVEFPVQFG